jgi:CRISPR-associated protein Csd1
MILQALNEYYERLKNNSDSDIPIQGMSRQKIHFALAINLKGELVQILDLRESVKNKKFPKQLVVPEPVKRTGNLEANFLWDNSGYVLGVGNKDNNERTLDAHNKFKALTHKIGDSVDDEGMKAVISFIDDWNPVEAVNLNDWQEIAGSNLVFMLEGERGFIHERPMISEAWLKYCSENASEKISTCLVKGGQKPISRLHPSIKGVRDAQSSGAAVISFNLDAFCSYGKDQNFNAPVSEEAAFAYTTVLNHLLSSDSRQKVQIGDATTVFWTERESAIEGFMGIILNPGDSDGDIKNVRDFLEAIKDGKSAPGIEETGMKFYILGLSPNASRLSVRFWHVSTVVEICEVLGQHFRDLSIVRQFADKDPEFPGMWRLLLETAAQRKTENINPLLAGALIRSILTGAPYPQTLLSSVIGRIRADQTMNYLRAAIIKACLVRKARINQNPLEVSMSLDKESTNIAYRLGRLFAALEKAQKDAVPGANTTIRDRYYGSASATPRVVFPQLLRLGQHHIQKSDYGFTSDKMIEEIMSGIQEFPAHLSLDEQGMFAIGYYHQRQAFFTKSEDKKED